MEREQAALVADQKSRLYAHPKTQQFLLEAIAEGGHLKTPDKSNDQAWARKRNVLGIYYGTSATQQEIGGMLRLPGKDKRQRVQQLLRRGIRQLRENGSDELKVRYPLPEIQIGASKGSAEEHSRKSGGKLAEVKALFAQRESFAEIAKHTGKSQAYVRRWLRKSRLIPESNAQKTKRFLEKLTEEIRVAGTDHDIKGIFLKMRGFNQRKFVQRHRELFLSIQNLARQLGFRFAGQELKSFTQVLTDAQIPFLQYNRKIKTGRNSGLVQTYYYLLAIQVPEVAGVFMRAPQLESFRKLKSWRQVAGPTVDLPSTNNLLHRRGYRAFLNEISTLGVKKKKLFCDCPVPVFMYRDSYIVHESDFETLIDYAKKIALRN